MLAASQTKAAEAAAAIKDEGTYGLPVSGTPGAVTAPGDALTFGRTAELMRAIKDDERLHVYLAYHKTVAGEQLPQNLLSPTYTEVILARMAGKRTRRVIKSTVWTHAVVLLTLGSTPAEAFTESIGYESGDGSVIGNAEEGYTLRNIINGGNALLLLLIKSLPSLGTEAKANPEANSATVALTLLCAGLDISPFASKPPSVAQCRLDAIGTLVGLLHYLGPDRQEASISPHNLASKETDRAEQSRLELRRALGCPDSDDIPSREPSGTKSGGGRSSSRLTVHEKGVLATVMARGKLIARHPSTGSSMAAPQRGKGIVNLLLFLWDSLGIFHFQKHIAAMQKQVYDRRVNQANYYGFLGHFIPMPAFPIMVHVQQPAEAGPSVTFKIYIRHSDWISNVKTAVNKMMEIGGTIDQQIVMVNGSVVLDEKTAGECGLTKGSEIIISAGHPAGAPRHNRELKWKMMRDMVGKIYFGNPMTGQLRWEAPVASGGTTGVNGDDLETILIGLGIYSRTWPLLTAADLTNIEQVRNWTCTVEVLVEAGLTQTDAVLLRKTLDSGPGPYYIPGAYVDPAADKSALNDARKESPAPVGWVTSTEVANPDPTVQKKLDEIDWYVQQGVFEPEEAARLQDNVLATAPAGGQGYVAKYSSKTIDGWAADQATRLKTDEIYSVVGSTFGVDDYGSSRPSSPRPQLTLASQDSSEWRTWKARTGRTTASTRGQASSGWVTWAPNKSDQDLGAGPAVPTAAPKLKRMSKWAQQELDRKPAKVSSSDAPGQWSKSFATETLNRSTEGIDVERKEAQLKMESNFGRTGQLTEGNSTELRTPLKVEKKTSGRKGRSALSREGKKKSGLTTNQHKGTKLGTSPQNTVSMPNVVHMPQLSKWKQAELDREADEAKIKKEKDEKEKLRIMKENFAATGVWGSHAPEVKPFNLKKHRRTSAKYKPETIQSLRGISDAVDSTTEDLPKYYITTDASVDVFRDPTLQSAKIGCIRGTDSRWRNRCIRVMELSPNQLWLKISSVDCALLHGTANFLSLTPLEMKSCGWVARTSDAKPSGHPLFTLISDERSLIPNAGTNSKTSNEALAMGRKQSAWARAEAERNTAVSATGTKVSDVASVAGVQPVLRQSAWARAEAERNTAVSTIDTKVSDAGVKPVRKQSAWARAKAEQNTTSSKLDTGAPRSLKSGGVESQNHQKGDKSNISAAKTGAQFQGSSFKHSKRMNTTCLSVVEPTTSIKDLESKINAIDQFISDGIFTQKEGILLAKKLQIQSTAARSMTDFGTSPRPIDHFGSYTKSNGSEISEDVHEKLAVIRKFHRDGIYNDKEASAMENDVLKQHPDRMVLKKNYSNYSNGNSEPLHAFTVSRHKVTSTKSMALTTKRVLNQELDVDVTRDVGAPLGIELVAGPDGETIVSALMPGGGAEKTGLIFASDQLVAVNGTRIEGLSIADVKKIICTDYDGNTTVTVVPNILAQTNSRTRDDSYIKKITKERELALSEATRIAKAEEQDRIASERVAVLEAAQKVEKDVAEAKRQSEAYALEAAKNAEEAAAAAAKKAESDTKAVNETQIQRIRETQIVDAQHQALKIEEELAKAERIRATRLVLEAKWATGDSTAVDTTTVGINNSNAVAEIERRKSATSVTMAYIDAADAARDADQALALPPTALSSEILKTGCTRDATHKEILAANKIQAAYRGKRGRDKARAARDARSLDEELAMQAAMPPMGLGALGIQGVGLREVRAEAAAIIAEDAKHIPEGKSELHSRISSKKKSLLVNVPEKSQSRRGRVSKWALSQAERKIKAAVGLQEKQILIDRYAADGVLSQSEAIRMKSNLKPLIALAAETDEVQTRPTSPLTNKDKAAFVTAPERFSPQLFHGHLQDTDPISVSDFPCESKKILFGHSNDTLNDDAVRKNREYYVAQKQENLQSQVYTVIEDFKAEEVYHLSLTCGDQVTVAQKGPVMWFGERYGWNINKDGPIPDGLFPKTHVAPIDVPLNTLVSIVDNSSNKSVPVNSTSIEGPSLDWRIAKVAVKSLVNTARAVGSFDIRLRIGDNHVADRLSALKSRLLLAQQRREKQKHIKENEAAVTIQAGFRGKKGRDQARAAKLHFTKSQQNNTVMTDPWASRITTKKPPPRSTQTAATNRANAIADEIAASRLAEEKALIEREQREKTDAANNSDFVHSDESDERSESSVDEEAQEDLRAELPLRKSGNFVQGRGRISGNLSQGNGDSKIKFNKGRGNHKESDEKWRTQLGKDAAVAKLRQMPEGAFLIRPCPVYMASSGFILSSLKGRYVRSDGSWFEGDPEHIPITKDLNSNFFLKDNVKGKKHSSLDALANAIEVRRAARARRKTKKQNEAAIVIQAGFRGKKVRANFKSLRYEKQRCIEALVAKMSSKEATEIIRQDEQGNRRSAAELVLSRKADSLDQFIQSLDMSVGDGAKINASRWQEEAHASQVQEQEAATKLQAGFRGKRDRDYARKKKKDESEAATKIQAGFRGKRGRCRYHEDRSFYRWFCR